MRCENCSKDIETVICPQCRGEVAKLGPFCYLCGKELVLEKLSPQEPDEDDFSSRVLCSDGNCIGVIDEKGFCKECGKPYKPESE